MEKYVTYLRVSTDSQGHCGLGIDAQRSTLNAKISPEKIIMEFVEVESGRNNKRPELTKALEMCKREGATLVVAKLDRLSRKASFIFNLMDSKVPFLCLDMPEFNILTIGLLAVFAQHEAEITSQRTKAALAALKAKGVKLGNKYLNTIERTGCSITRQTANVLIKPYVQSLHQNGLTMGQIAKRLNEENKVTTNGFPFSKSQIQYLLKSA